ncbi:hypothetical protein AVEN_232390-1 [Araneus ventricosus]|uniref:Uncharacterized protein n=1 Tax=Araneus ventricosus TaxID=182803 RepID=A0A4Y2CU06_ARAVE|nr:hypothetical protein AVEN_232390-1 [Araneus ventricosus]
MEFYKRTLVTQSARKGDNWLKFGERVPTLISSSSSDRGSKLLGKFQNSLRVASKRDVNKLIWTRDLWVRQTMSSKTCRYVDLLPSKSIESNILPFVVCGSLERGRLPSVFSSFYGHFWKIIQLLYVFRP